ncbi:wound induced protein [Iris pallida]|uniref:Wound induced protein n=1 Tax=Iris pallida TaxID=29817 RepID=A0AAX6HN25_IRIPA|nr:wound induced protein [Iris pallida]
MSSASKASWGGGGERGRSGSAQGPGALQMELRIEVYSPRKNKRKMSPLRRRRWGQQQEDDHSLFFSVGTEN